MVQKKSKSSKFLRSCIFEALMLLMEQKDYDDIAISEIAAKAGVSRMTYYRTYSSKEDIFLQYFEEYIEENFPKPDETQQEDFKPYLKAVLQAAKEHQELITLLEKNPKLAKICLKFFLDHIQSLLIPQDGETEPNPLLLYNIYYYTGAISLMIHHWIASGLHESVDEMMEIFSQFDTNSLENLKRQDT